MSQVKLIVTEGSKATGEVISFDTDAETQNGRYCCPFHHGSHYNFAIFNGGLTFKCHSECGKSGKVVDAADYIDYEALKQEQVDLLATDNQSLDNWCGIVTEAHTDEAVAQEEVVVEPVPVKPLPVKATAKPADTQFNDIFGEDTTTTSTKVVDWGNVIREHIYKDIYGKNIKKKTYFGYIGSPGKTPRQYRWEAGAWVTGLTFGDGSKVKEILYNSHLFKNYTDRIFITEGEKDCDTLVSRGGLATTLGSASSIISGIHKKYLLNRDVIVLSQDRDKSGAKWLYKTISNLINMGYPIDKIRYANFANPNSIKGFDITDALKAGIYPKMLPITDDIVKAELWKYDIDINDIISNNHFIRAHQNFPRGIFRKDVEEMIDNIASATSTNYANAAHTFLPIVSYLVCDKFYFQEGSFRTYLTLSNILIADSGDTKSNARDLYAREVDRIGQEKAAEHKDAMDIYKIAYANYKATKNKMGLEPPEPPLRSVVCLTNMTIPALTGQFVVDKKLFLFNDEISNILNGFNQFSGGKGNEKDEFMAMINNKQIDVLRKNKNGTTNVITIPLPLLPIFGTIQWDRIQTMTTDKESGFPYRFLYSAANKMDYKLLPRDQEHVYHSAVAEYTKIFNALLDMTGVTDNVYCSILDEAPVPATPTVTNEFGMVNLKLSDEAYTRWSNFIEGHFNTLIKEFAKENKNLNPLLAKMRPQLNKLMCLLHVLNNYDNPSAINGEISADTVEKAERLVMYYATQAFRVFFEREISENKHQDSNFLRISKFMNRNGLQEVTRNMLNQKLFQKLNVEEIQEILDGLEKQGYLKCSKKGKSILIKLI